MFHFNSHIMSTIPTHLARVLAASSSVGFSGSRHAHLVPSVALSVMHAVPVSARVFVGCAHGLDSAARSFFPHALVYRVSSFGSGRGAYARRSIALVSGLASQPSPVFISFPGVACPVGLVPSASPSACFSGLGSGSWASLALAVGLGLPCFFYLPPSIVPPVSWGALCLFGGWWFIHSV